MTIAVLCPQCGIACDVPVAQFNVERPCPVCGGRFLPAAARREPLAPAALAPLPPAPPPVAAPPVPLPPPPVPRYPLPAPAVPPHTAPTGRGVLGVVIGLIVFVRIVGGLFSGGTSQTPPAVDTNRFEQLRGPDYSAATGAARAEIIGTWRLVYQSSRPLGAGNYDYGETKTFRANGTMTRTSPWGGIGGSEQGTYRIVDDKTLSWTFNGVTSQCRIVSLWPRNLTITYTAGDGSTVDERYVYATSSP